MCIKIQPRDTLRSAYGEKGQSETAQNQPKLNTTQRRALHNPKVTRGSEVSAKLHHVWPLRSSDMMKR